MRRLLLALGLTGLIALTVADPAPAAADTAGFVPPGKIDSLLLSGDELSDIVGVQFEWQKTSRKPFRSENLGSDSACALLIGPDAETFGRDYTGFRFRVNRDHADNAEFIVQQRAATYPDAAGAASAFQQAFTNGVLAKCNGTIVRPEEDPKAQFRFRVRTITPAVAQWVEDQLYQDEPIGYSCSNIAGVQGNVVYAAKVCQFGNGGPAAATLADRMTSQLAGMHA